MLMPVAHSRGWTGAPTAGEARSAGAIRSPGAFLPSLATLLHPGPAPRGWWRFAAWVVGGSAAAAVVFALAGWLLRDDPGKYFGEKRPGTLLSVGLLLASAWTCRQIHRLAAAAPFGRFWIVQGFLFLYLAVDELFRVHERLDRLVHSLLGLNDRHPVTDHLDDAIIGLYALVAAGLWLSHRVLLIRLRWMVLTMAAAFAAFAAMLVLDVTGGSKAVEDGVKIVSCSLIFVAFAAAQRQLAETADGRIAHGLEQADVNPARAATAAQA